MIEKNELNEVRRQVDGFVGNRVTIRANKGRKRIVIREGYIERTYPSIFVVSIHNKQQDNYRKVSYSYADILTHNVDISPCE